MGLEKNFKNVQESFKILKMTLVIAFLFNLSTIHEWLQQKEASGTTASFLKLTQALNDLGDDFLLNTFRNSIRSRFFSKNIKLEPLVNPVTPDGPLIPNKDRAVAAIDPVGTEIIEEIDVSDFNFIDEIIDEPVTIGGLKKGVLVVGDSILKSGLQEHFERNLTKRDQTLTVEVISKSGTGLSRPDVFDWVKLIDQTKEQYEKVVIFLGTNDAQNLILDKKVIPFDSKEWKAEYGLRVRKLVEVACTKSTQVYWVSALKMRSETFDAKMRSLHDVVRKEIKSQPSCARFVSVASWFTKKSKYTDTWTTESKKSGKKTIKLRVSDGIHLTYWGADLFSQKLIDSIYE